MPKKRRKLNKDFEKEIYTSKKNVELVLAKIYDIDDEDIQKEYMIAFRVVEELFVELKEDYEKLGFNNNSTHQGRVLSLMLFELLEGFNFLVSKVRFFISCTLFESFFSILSNSLFGI